MSLLTITQDNKAQTGLYKYGDWYFDIVEVNEHWLWRLFKRNRDNYVCIIISSNATLDPELQVTDVKLFIDSDCINKNSAVA